MLDNTWHPRGNTWSHTLTRPQNLCNRRLAIKQSRCKTGHMTILDIQRHTCSDWWGGYEGKVNYNTGMTTTKCTGAGAQQTLGHRKTRLTLLVKYECCYWRSCKRLLSMYGISANTTYKQNSTHEIPVMQTIGTDLFTLNNNHFLHIVDYHTRFWVTRWAEGLSPELIRCCTIIFVKYGLPYEIISNTGSNFILVNSKNIVESWTQNKL